MERKRRKREGGGLLVLALALFVAVLGLTVAPSTAWAEGEVAEVNGQEYTSIDEAIAAANDGDTITLLADAAAAQTFYKSLIFTGGHTLTVDAYSWRYSGNLVFDGADFEMVVDEDSPAANNGEISNWLGMSLTNGSIVATNGASVTFSFDSKSGVNCAIYGTNADIIVEKNSTFSIYGKNTKGVIGQGLQLDSPRTVGISVTGESSFLIDGTNRGYVCSPDIYVEDSNFTVQNCTANASNGGLFTAVNSNITFDNNVGHGLSASSVVIDGSQVTATDNGYCGFVLSGNLDVSNGSVITVTGNAWQDDTAAYAGMRLNGSSTSNTYDIDGSTVLTICDNYNTGLDVRRGTLTIADGADVTITGNSVNNTLMAGYGGGLYVGYSTYSDWAKVIMPADILICNNHALNGGDDIYVATGAEGARSSITIMPVQDGQTLDGMRLTSGGNQDTLGSVDDDCTDVIDGWYLDGMDGEGALDASMRWEAHADSYEDVYAEPYTVDGVTTVEGPLALKAAHGIGSAEVSFDVMKVLEGAELVDGQFEFTIEDTDGAGYSKTVSNDDDGTVDFGTFVYDSESENHFIIYEVDDGQDNITYDATVYAVTVDVDWSGKDASFVGSVSLDGLDNSSMVFVNTYQAEEPVTPGDDTTVDDGSGDDVTTDGGDATTSGEEIPKTGDPTSIAAVALAAATGLGAIGAGALVGRRRK